MSEKFSPALRIGDLNDFIAPSQGCIVGQLKPNSVKPVNNSEVSAILWFFYEFGNPRYFVYCNSLLLFVILEIILVRGVNSLL